MYKIFQREHAIYISNDQLNLDDFDIVLNNPTKRVLEQLVMNLDDLRKKPKKIWIRANEQEYFDKIRFLFREIKAGGGAVFNPLGELLLIKRLGFWDLPKGKWQKGETIEECAIREVEEECNVFGLQIINTLIPTFHLYNYRGKWAIKKSIWYTMISQDWKLAKPQLEEDIEEIKWVKLDDAFMQDLYTYPAIREVLTELLSRREDIF